MINGIDTRDIGLVRSCEPRCELMLEATLRTALGLVPQEPMLFTGTLRHNLDPFKAYTDGRIRHVDSMKSQHQLVEEGGELLPLGKFCELLVLGCGPQWNAGPACPRPGSSGFR